MLHFSLCFAELDEDDWCISHVCTVNLQLAAVAGLAEHKDWKKGESASLAMSKVNVNKYASKS